MKSLISLGCIAILIALILQFCQPPLETTDIVVLEDKTDTFIAKPDPKDILPLYGLSDNQFRGGNFRYVPISDIRFGITAEAHLQAVQELQSSQITRRSEVQVFQENIAKALYSEKGEAGKSHSAVYSVFAKEANALAKSKSQKRILIVFSDLMENSTANFYDPKTFALLQSNPKEIESLFEKEVPLDDLSGIEIWVVFHAKDYIASNEFAVVSGFYRRLAESKGATFKISANLTPEK